MTLAVTLPGQVLKSQGNTFFVPDKDATWEDIVWLPILDLGNVQSCEMEWHGPLYIADQNLDVEVSAIGKAIGREQTLLQ
eukprot:1201118-Lingulodinium_polyedra.AAC.1